MGKAVQALSVLPGFDPRAVPALPLPDLPPVPPEHLTPDALRVRFRHPPAWAPDVRQEPRLASAAPRRAAVLMPLVTHPGGLTVLLTERTTQLRTHAGQIAFPGGQADPQDRDPAATALREAGEEIALPPAAAQVLGLLPPYVTSSRYNVTPVVALIDPDFTPRQNPVEVAQIFEVPLSFLMNPAHHRWHRYMQDSGPGGPARAYEWFSMPWHGPAAFGGPPHDWFIWGVTAGMLRNFYRFLAA
ncbi:MAG: CoA pyrophosphatase [Burkholderiaceae bacterium]|jgi:8-oxo-dGTP pyrophosphatase MutT (NUDIX family)|nr:CoA pyrophosphatase [Burkholderiaceae bacterium]